MLHIVIVKPMQFTKVKEVPLDTSGALWATSLENKGESAMTTILQKNRNPIKTTWELLYNKSGDTMQHKQERKSAMNAILLAPNRSDSRPLPAQASPPDAMIRKVIKGTLIFASG